VLTGCNLVHIAREPLQLSDVTIQPVLFTLLFVYVFGAGVVLPGGGGYTDFAIAGLLALNLTTSAMGTAVGLSNDLNSGVIDRFRTLPMWRAAVLVGRSLADLSTAALCTLIVVLTGLVIGWRPHASILAVIGGCALFLFFNYALSWGCGCLGTVSKGPESAQGLGLVILFPLAIVSNGLVPTPRMPAVLRFIADWNPVSAVTAAARHLFGNPNPSATVHAWPMEHPVAASLLWSVRRADRADPGRHAAGPAVRPVGSGPPGRHGGGHRPRSVRRAQLVVSFSAAVRAASAVRRRKPVRSWRSLSSYPAQIWSIAVFIPDSTR
jgi:ABC-2 type transport system permease protein